MSAPGTDEAEALRAADRQPTPEVADGEHGPPRFGKYRLHRLLARGGMGEVYLASLVGELGFEKRLVIKTILPEFASQPQFIQMFAAEAKTAVALSHGNIVPIYELGRADETFYIVMGYVDGPSVSQLLSACRRAQRSPDPGVALHVIRGVLTGLAYAHTHEPGRPAVVHRDITPRNILLDRSGQVRIVDFGIALPANVQVNLRAGSTGYMAPEQARAEAADPRADVFSTACLLYELLTHEPAFPRDGVWTMPALDAVPEEARAPLERALAVEPDDRPTDAGAFLELLGPALARHAATFGDPSLAAHLRQVFPDGWSSDSEAPSEGDITPSTSISPKTQTFATRLTAVTPERGPSDGAETGDGAPSPSRTDGDPDRATSSPAASAVRDTALAATSIPAGSPATSMSAGGMAQWSSWRSILVGAAGAGIVLLVALALLPGDPPPAATSNTKLEAPPPPSQTQSPPQASSSGPGGSRAPSLHPPQTSSPRHHTVRLEPADAELLVDGERVPGSSPFELVADAEATVSLTVRKRGYETRSLSWGPDLALPELVRLTKLRPKGNGSLRVTAPTVAWAEVTIDGRKRGSTPTRRLTLPAGSHRVTVRCVPDVCPTERVLYDRTVEIDADQTVEVAAQ